MSQFKEFYRAEQLPVSQNRIYRAADDARKCIKGDIALVQDMETGLIFNQAFNAELIQYDADYQNEQAVSSVFRAHLSEVSEIIKKHLQNSTLIEVGCGKGFFLEYLQKLGLEITGLDPAYEGSNPSIIKKYFTLEIGLRADGIILRHVLEHIQDPVSFLANIRDSNAGKGKIYIEVPCFDWICKHNAWFDIFYEHVNYFRLADFYRIFGSVYEAGHTFNGQYLYVVADLATLGKPAYDDQCHLEFPEGFLDTVNQCANRLKNTPNRELKAKTLSVIWGGASKGAIFALFMQRARATANFVVDINPVKQGKYLPVTGYRIYAPEEMISQAGKPIDIFVMNSNYLDEIKQLTNNQCNYFTVDH